ncbi:MAG: glycosyltransferase [Armatimonadota bacterium]|nr:glycosyltransferase [Armatimonadota bacterium]
MFASTTETQGLVIGEAMTHGLPAVAARGGGASDNIVDDETGVIVGSSVIQISDAVKRLLGNPALLGRLSESCRRTSRDWTHSASCARVLEVYSQVLESRGMEAGINDHVHSRAH